MGVFTLEAAAEGDRVLASRNFYVKTNGKIAHSINTDTVRYLMKGLTSRPSPTIPVTEKYREESSSTFEHYGETFSINKVHEIIEQKNIPISQLNSVNDLGWLLETSDSEGLRYKDLVDEKRVAAADTDTPMIVLDDPRCKLVVVDGLHRLTKAVQIEKRKTVPCYVLKYKDIVSARVVALA